MARTPSIEILVQVKRDEPIGRRNWLGVLDRCGRHKCFAGTQAVCTGFVTTSGFRDVLRIAYQNRPKLFDLQIRKPTELYADVLEVDERNDKDGRAIVPIDERRLREGLQRFRDQGIASLAVCLMNANRNDAHERTVKRIGQELGFDYVSCGVTKLKKIVSRGDTFSTRLNPKCVPPC